ncbi:hypothetical protein [Luteolibacter marinus]|uniref:hypothetical protein n=1 Tax=Luteolibacter marinus TaxID=2776705 RepID=UPI001868D391|nr:hypothetical protein [Luteolibacter marinus]
MERTPKQIWNDLRRQEVSGGEWENKGLEKFEKLRLLVDEMIEALYENGSGIDSFFQAVGQGVVDAQRGLDEQTLDYLADNPVVPTTFRIPKTTAEIHFSAKQRTSGSLLARVFSRTEEQEQMTRHSVQFEVVAVPPPPELLQELNTWLAGFVVTNLAIRRLVRDGLVRFASDATPDSKKERADRLVTLFNRTIVLQGGGSFGLLLLFEDGNDEKWKIDGLSIDPTAPADATFWLAQPLVAVAGGMAKHLAPFLTVQQSRLDLLDPRAS